MLTEETVDKCLQWLVDNTNEAAQRRANRLALEEGRKALKAVIMKEHADLPVSAQEREAYADPRYAEHIAGLREAVFRDEQMRMRRETRMTLIEVYRTQCANLRGLK